ncbi:MAG: 1-acyl-sn-glycerol-3-phosphate acyltransferase [Myxococcales bacterium]|nr:1-acyl-sn-glycerol-3-phosphate acyltransferase [Myxococcales bacterium]
MIARRHSVLGRLLDSAVDDEIRARVARMGTPFNELGYDSWGGSRLATERMLALSRWFYRTYFRTETRGVELIPPGRVLLIGNHSSQLAYDGMVVAAAVALEGDPPRHVHAMVERFFAGQPFVNVFMARTGQQIGLPRHCERLLTRDEAAVLVFPEGARGGGKVFRDRYKIMGFGTGFMRIALRTRTPIVPFGFVGGEEMCPSFSEMKPLARLLGAPYLPLTPTLLPLPLPARCYLRFGPPMRFEGVGDEADEVIGPMVADVEHTVAALIADGLERREHIFF